MKLHQNQLDLIRHLAQFSALNYLHCLDLLNTERLNNKKGLSYMFRPLTKNSYLAKRKDGVVTILAKGRALFPDVSPLVKLGGGQRTVQRVCAVSRIAALLGSCGIKSYSEITEKEPTYFIPSTCWRKIRPGILSTTRFTGILFTGEHRLAVYDIGNGNIEWQLRAERSLFYTNYGAFETKATGLLLISDDSSWKVAAERIIRTTMWQRKQLIQKVSIHERERPVRYTRSPIRAAWYYEHVYLTSPKLLNESIREIADEDSFISKYRNEGTKCDSPKQGDFEQWPYRYFINVTTDLLKYVYYFAAVKGLISIRGNQNIEVNYAIVLPKRDFFIMRLYPDVIDMEGAKFLEYKPFENNESD